MRPVRENGRMKPTKLILGAGALAGTVHLAASLGARKLAEGPDPYQLEELLHPAPGTEAIIVGEDGTRVHTTSAGSGAPVLFAHGYGLTSTEFSVLAERLIREGRRVITFDQRGHGGSSIGRDGVGSSQMASDYAAVIEHYDLDDAVLVGHSMGGFLAIKFLLDHPDLAGRLRGLVLMGSTAGDIAEGAPQHQIEIPLIKAGVITAIGNTHTYGTLLAASVVGRRSPSILEAFRTMFVGQNHPAIHPAAEMLVDESNYPRLGEIQVPTRVICGTSDITTPPNHSERLVAGIPNATLTWVDGAGHLLNWEAVEEVLAEILAL